MTTQLRKLKENHWNIQLVIPAILCAVSLLAYAGSGSRAVETSSSLCDGVPQASCTNNICLISYASHRIYCVSDANTYQCTLNGTANVTITDWAGECEWGGICTCFREVIADTRVVPNTPVYITTGPYPEA